MDLEEKTKKEIAEEEIAEEYFMTPEQLDLTNQLFAAAYNAADNFGSEASEVAQLILTSKKNLESCKTFFPKSFKAEPLSADQFKAAARDSDIANNLLSVLPDAKQSFGVFREDDSSWWLCVFWDSKSKLGSNAFFRAHRVET